MGPVRPDTPAPNGDTMISLLLLSTAAMGFETTMSETGEEITWDIFPVEWTISLEGAPESLSQDEWIEAISASFDTWEAVEETKVRFSETQLEFGAGSVADEENTIWFETDWDAEADVGAIASTWVDGNTIVGFDIRINAETVKWSTDGSETDAQAAVTHEIGHTVGVGHSDLERATMYYELTGEDTVRRYLDRDDKRAIRHLYSDRVLEVPEFLSCNSAPSAGWTPWALVALLILRRQTPHRRES